MFAFAILGSFLLSASALALFSSYSRHVVSSLANGMEGVRAADELAVTILLEHRQNIMDRLIGGSRYVPSLAVLRSDLGRLMSSVRGNVDSGEERKLFGNLERDLNQYLTESDQFGERMSPRDIALRLDPKLNLALNDIRSLVRENVAQMRAEQASASKWSEVAGKFGLIVIVIGVLGFVGWFVSLRKGVRFPVSERALRFEPTDLRDLARHVIEHRQSIFTSHQFYFQVPAEAVFPEWDSQRAAEVLDQLLSAAMNSTPQGGVIGLRMEKADDHVTLSVSAGKIEAAPVELPLRRREKAAA